MPGRSVPESVENFIEPLRRAVSCLGAGHIGLTPGARGDVGETHMWTLNGGAPMRVGDHGLDAQMHFEVQDRGRSQGSDRFKVSTSAYLYALTDADGMEVLAAHWHPTGKSHVAYPHWHLGSAALSESGVWLKRAHIPSPRVSFEFMVRSLLDLGIAEPAHDDWQDRLAETERMFDEHKSW